jgi:methyl-accepting chemotaxis protein
MTIEERVEFLQRSIESHGRQLGEITEKLDHLATKVDQISEAVAALVRVTNEDATAIRTLTRIALAHEQRISDLDGKGQRPE